MEIRTFGDVLFSMRESDGLSVICGNEQITYRELWNDGFGIAKGLIKAGVHKGDRIAVDTGRTLEYARMMAGIAICGAIGVNIDRMQQKPHIERILKDSTPVLIVDEAGAKKLRESGNTDMQTSAEELLCTVNGEDPFWLTYSSGSTGTPKASVLCHRTVLISCRACAQNVRTQYMADHCERILVDAALSFMLAIFFFPYAFCNKKTVVFANEQEFCSLTDLASCIKRNRVDFICRPQSWLLKAVENPDYADAIGTVRLFSIGGEKNTDEVVRIVRKYAPAAAIFLTYGTSELIYVTDFEWAFGKTDLLGQPFSGVEIFLLDDNGEPVKAGMTGEICVGGETAVLGSYWNAPELTAKVYEMHPAYGRICHTGDLGRIEADGQIHILGRKDNMIKIRGVRIEPEYLEHVLRGFPGIREAAVVLTDIGVKTLCACYTCDDTTLDEMELRRYLADELPYYMIPSCLRRIDQMPLNSSGKLDRKRLAELLTEKRKTVLKETGNHNKEIAELLCRIFAQVLRLPENQVNADDDFFSLGGDSLSALEAVYLMSREGYKFEVKWLYAAPSPALLSAFISRCDDTEHIEPGENIKASREKQRKEIQDILGRSISSVHPVSVLVNENLKPGYPWMRFAACAVRKVFTRDEWKRRMKLTADTHEMLRSVFVENKGQYLRAVLTESEPECFYVDLSRQSQKGNLWSLPQQRYFDTMTHLLLNEEAAVFGHVLFRSGCIRISEDTSILLFYYSHALLDLIGVENLLWDILHENDEDDTALFEKHTDRILYGDRNEAYSYWKSICTDRQALITVPGPRKTMNSGNARIRLTGDKNTRSRVNTFCETKGISLAAFMHMLLGRVLCGMSEKDSASFLSVCSARDGEMFHLSGMFAGMIPFHFAGKDNYADLQEKLIKGQTHSWLMNIPQVFDEMAGSLSEGILLDIVEDSGHERGAQDNLVSEIQQDLNIRELVLLHEQKKRHPEEDGRLTVYVNRSWSELYVIEFDPGLVDTAFAVRLQEALKKELDRVTAADVKSRDFAAAKRKKQDRKVWPPGGPAASVLTPVHEVKLPLLERAFASLQNQRFGFDNLEWVILLHNCSPAYKEEVYRRFEKYDNILIDERDVPGTSLQYARSELVGMASGKYLFFLDGDDEITPSCVSKAVAAMEETGADLSTWAVTIRSGTYDMWFCCDADPVQGNLVLEKGDPRMGSTLCFSGPGLWAHAFRRSFLEEKNVRFNAESEAGKTCQDVDFVFDAVLSADRAVIMPRLTGYIYYYGIGMFNAAGAQAAYDLLSLVDRYRHFYRDAGLAADNLIWAAMSIGLHPVWKLTPKALQQAHLQVLRECFEWLKPPKMNWPALQEMADYAYVNLKKMLDTDIGS